MWIIFVSKDYSEFLNWFSGFTDAEGQFGIVIYRKNAGFRFVISLHLDDLEVLKYIKYKLSSIIGKEVGSNYIHKKIN